MTSLRSLLFIALLLLCSTIVFAQTGEEKAAENAAVSFLQRLHQGDLGDVYDTQLSSRFQNTTARKQFVQQGGMMRIQMGGPPSSRQLVGGQLVDQLPSQPPLQGQFYYVRYRANYPQAQVFEDVYLEKVSSSWKVLSFWFVPTKQ